MHKRTGLIALFFSLVTMAVWAVGPVGTAPLNPDFVSYMEARARGETEVDVARGMGHVPPPYRLPPFTEEQDRQLRARALPASYDLRASGKVTAVRDQGQEGACWAFAAYGSMESRLLVQNAGTWDFSENHMVNMHGGDLGRNDGGNHFLATAYLARWSGPVLESEDPYPSPTSPAGLRPSKHVQQVVYLPARRNAGDNNAIKQALKDYGALYTSMYANDNYLNRATAGFYYNGSASPNHGVTIVGWDDNYSKNNFKTTPPGNGAFIVKNSWGTGWGDNGYFYASYYDTKFGSDNAAFMNAESATNYDKVYQYDPLGMVLGFGYEDNVIWGANMFTATASHSLRAVSFYAVEAGVQYQIYVYTGCAAGSPRSGTLRSQKSGTLSKAGYHTIALSSAVSLTSGQRFSVVVKITAPTELYPMPMEYAMAGYSSAARAEPGQSFFSPNGSSWKDLTSWNSTANFCIKAFAGTGSQPGPDPAPERIVANDFDGDGKSDYVVFHYPTGRWYIWSSRARAWYANGVQWGSYGYLPVPGDYDGRGKADAMAYSRWHSHFLGYCQESGSRISVNAGGDSFIPVAGDFDGDGKSDLALYNFQNGAWFIYGSRAGWMANGHVFGGSGWLPFVADYTGDGYNEIVIYNTSTGLWRMYNTQTGLLGTVSNFGGPGYIPVPGDFDGDGKADLALYNYNNGRWFIASSLTEGWFAYNWLFGDAGYLPVIGDYNGSGRDNIAVYSELTGYWGVYWTETGNYSVFDWGGRGLVPVVPWWLYWYYGI